MPTNTFLNLESEKKTRILKAVIDEFSEKQYEQVQISDIIKHAKIPRGSFYQYFVDKEDLYLYLIDIIRNEKMLFLMNTLGNSQGMNFLDLVRKLYDDGVKFALRFPQYVKILDHLLKNKSKIYEKLMSDNIKIAEDIYADLIDKDKAKGLIKEDIDTRTFSRIIVQLTANIAVEELDMNHQDESYQKMLERNNQVLKIIERGVLKG